jgi:aspartyl/glutamyl-tRNA(Asn/Gln) amidotransferase C subunit
MEKHIIDLDQIDHLANLSMLNFTDKEREIMLKEVGGIVNMLEQCEDVQLTERSKPKIVSLGDLREDNVKPSLKKDSVIEQAVDSRSDYFCIPKVVD